MGVVKLADYRRNPVQHQEASSMGYVSIHRQFMDSRLYRTLRQYIFGFT